MTGPERPAPGPFCTSRLVFGLVMLGLGVVWTLDVRGLFDASRVTAWWPAVAGLWGAMLYTGIGTRRRRALGLACVLVALVAGSNHLGLSHFTLWDLIPMFLVCVGAVLVFRAWRGTRFDGGSGAGASGGAGPGGGMAGGGMPRGGGVGAGMGRGGAGSGARSATSDGARANFFSFLAGQERRVTAQEFLGGEATAILGGLTLDLRGARLAQGRAVLDVFAMWGGIEILAPAGWRVVSRVTPLLGALVDSMPPVADAGAPTLELRGLAVMGGVDVRSDDRVRVKVRRAVIGAQFAPGVTVGVSGSRRRPRVDVRVEAGDIGPDDPAPPADPGPAER